MSNLISGRFFLSCCGAVKLGRPIPLEAAESALVARILPLNCIRLACLWSCVEHPASLGLEFASSFEARDSKLETRNCKLEARSSKLGSRQSKLAALEANRSLQLAAGQAAAFLQTDAS